MRVLIACKAASAPIPLEGARSAQAGGASESRRTAARAQSCTRSRALTGFALEHVLRQYVKVSPRDGAG